MDIYNYPSNCMKVYVLEYWTLSFGSLGSLRLLFSSTDARRLGWLSLKARRRDAVNCTCIHAYTMQQYSQVYNYNNYTYV